MLAYEIRAYIQAGLQLAGKDDSGELLWMGTERQWSLAEKLKEACLLGNELVETYFKS